MAKDTTIYSVQSLISMIRYKSMGRYKVYGIHGLLVLYNDLYHGYFITKTLKANASKRGNNCLL